MKKMGHSEPNVTSPDCRLKVVIAGAGPAGLTAAYELTGNQEVDVTVFESSGKIGGISRTEVYKGNRIDIGGHRFFSKSDRVMEWWDRLMPVDADPEKTDRTMLRRRRVSRIFYLRRFFEYPVKLSYQTVRNLGLWRTLKAGCSYLKSAVWKRKEITLEDFYINRFGKTLYRMFFEDYTTKVWGKHPSELGADWGAQRVKGLSLAGVLKDIVRKTVTGRKSGKEVETSLIEEFIYPKYGPGQLWETVAREVENRGGEVVINNDVSRIHVEDGKVAAVTVTGPDGQQRRVACDVFISSMPLKELVERLDGIDIPEDVMKGASALPYRDFITVGLLVDRMKLRNETRLKTFRNRIPDTWIYIQERDVRLGRLQIFNNWSPYMVADDAETMWIGLEYFCSEGDDMWEMDDQRFIAMAVDELVKIDVIDRDAVKDAVRIKVRKAYPAYYGSYSAMPAIRGFLDGIPNLYCVGRNGQHRYNNMDHSMLTAMAAVESILDGKEEADKSAVWDVNTETDYHETKR